MPVGWFLVPFKRDTSVTYPRRLPAVWDMRAQIQADGGFFACSEVLGNYAITKVRASSATLQAIGALQGVRRLPKDRLDDPLSSLTNTQKTTLRNWIESLGYPRAEWQQDLGNDLGAVTLRQVLQFIRKRRLKPRYDTATDTIILDGPVQATRRLEDVDSRVRDV